MRPPIYDVYQMKADRLPDGTKSAWLRTWPDERPDRRLAACRERALPEQVYDRRDEQERFLLPGDSELAQFLEVARIKMK